MSKITRQELEEKFGKPCIEVKPSAALPPTGDLPESTADQIATCIENATAEVERVTPNIPTSQVFRKTGITILNQPFILDAIEYAQEHPDTIPPTLNITDMASNIRRFNVFMLLFRLGEVLLRALRWAFRIFATRAFEQFRMYYQYVQTLARQDDNDAQVIYERLRPYFARGNRGQRIDNLEHQTMGSTDHKEDLEIDLEVAKELMEHSNERIKNIIKKEKELKRDVDKNLHQIDDLVDEK